MQDFTKRISVVIDKDLPSWQALNTLAHISAYFGHYLGKAFDTGDFFRTQDNHAIPRNSQYPIIIFEAQAIDLPKFAQKVKELSEIQTMYFVREMIEASDDAKLAQAIGKTSFPKLDVLGVGIFGENSVVKALTKEFKLWS